MSLICHIHNYTEYNEEGNVFSAFNPSKCTHTWSSGQPTLRRPGSSWGFGALLKGLTSVVDTSCQSWDSNPQPRVTSGFKSNALSIRPRLPFTLSSLLGEHRIISQEWGRNCSVFLGWLVANISMIAKNLFYSYQTTEPSSGCPQCLPHPGKL